MNSLTSLYRKYLADTGQTDERDDYFITQELGQWAQQSRPGLFEVFPDFGKAYGDIREANAPSLPAEFGRAAKRATLGLGATASGAVNLFTDSDYFRDKARELEERAAAPEIAATIPTMEDITPGETGVRSLLDRDTIRYATSKVGEAAPSIAEGIVTAGVGAAAGSAVAPGPGTIAGGAAGLLGRSAVKAGIREMIKRGAREGAESLAEGLVKRGVLKEATEEAIETAVRSGVKPVIDAVTANARRISALRGGQAAAIANSYGLSAGEIYNETDDRGLALGFGAVAAVPDTILPTYVLRRMFPGVALTEARSEGKNLVSRFAREALTTSSIEAGTEAFQESVNIVARNIKDGRSPTDFSDEDWSRVREAAVTGAAGGALVAPAAAVGGSSPEIAIPSPAVARPATPARPVAPPTGAAPVVAGPRSTVARLNKLSDTEKRDRLAQLQAKEERTAAEERELVILQQITPQVEAVAPVVTPETPLPAPTTVPPTELGALVTPPAVAAPLAPTTPEQQAAFDAARQRGEAFALPRAMVGENPAPEADLLAGRGQPLQEPVSEAGSAPDIGAGVEVARAPASVVQEVLAMDAPAFVAWTKRQPGGAFTPVAYETGIQVIGNPAAIEELKAARTAAEQQYAAAMAQFRGGDTTAADSAMALASKSQFFREAIEAAENTGSAATSPVVVAAHAGSTQGGIPNALQEQSPASLLQSQPPAVGTPGSERGGVQPILQGTEITGTQTPVVGSGTQAPQAGAAADGGVIPPAPALRTTQTQTPEFRAWFGDSKVVDENGEPQRAVHYTNANFDSFSLDAQRKARWNETGYTRSFGSDYVFPRDGFFFFVGDAPPSQRSDAHAVPVFLSIKNPLDLTKPIPAEDASKIIDWVKMKSETPGDAGTASHRISGKWVAGLKRARNEGITPEQLWDLFNNEVGDRRQWNEMLSYLGKDGLIMESNSSGTSTLEKMRGRGDGKTYKVAVALNPTQIKSAIGNRGTFDPTNPDIALRQAPQPSALQATRTHEFQAVLARLIANGASVQTFSHELFNQSVAETIQQQIAELEARLPQATAAQRAELTQAIELRQQRLADLTNARGVTYSPWQIAIATSDVANASLDNLVTLLHEAAESLTMRLTPAMQGAVFRGVEKATAEMSSRMRAAAAQTGATVANVPDASELLAETLAQSLAAEGIQDAPSLAQAIARFIKDIYYRVSMALQASFGIEPNPELAVRWYENQLRRELGGDFDYRFAHLLDRFLPQSNAERLTKLSAPTGMADFFDPVTQKITQPWVEPDSDDALDWNMQFQTVNPGDTEGIPYDEAVLRQTAAGYNEIIRWLREQHQALAPDTDFDTFARQFGRGTRTPIQMLNDIAQRMPGAETATIGGERMTDAMNKWAAHQAVEWLYKLRAKHNDTVANLTDEAQNADAEFTAQANELNRMESDVRNAALHEAELKDKARKLVQATVKTMRSGLRTSTQLGRMMTDQENISPRDPLPAFYEQVFNGLADGTLPLFEYVEAIALLDLPLSQMTPEKVWAEILKNADSNPRLQELTRNKPLALTLSVLASENSRQLDQIQLRRADAVTYRDARAELQNIRNATEAQLREMISTLDERNEAKGLRERLKLAYLKERRKLQKMSASIVAAEERIDLLTRAKPAVDAKTAEMEQAMGGVFSDWQPVGGAEYSAMRLGEDGQWSPVKRTLEFNADGSAVDGDSVRRDIALNLQWLRENQAKSGQKFYNTVKQQTEAMGMLDVQRAYQAANYGKIMGIVDSLVRPIQGIAKQAGHSAGQRIGQQFNQYAYILRFSDRYDVLARKWTNQMQGLQKLTGIKDNGRFRSEIYNPVMYFLGVNPGLDEAQAIRAATRQARARLTGEVPANFDERFGNFLRQTKEVNDELVKLAEQYKVFVQDPKLGGTLRRALDRGWLTGMRSMDAGVVSTLLRDMENAGWKLGEREISKGRKQVVGTTFDALDPANATSPEERGEYFAQLENGDLLRQALDPLFTPRIVNDWLAPFLNKPGEPVFRYAGQSISQLDVQEAWNNSNGDVLTWIDNLGQKVGVEPNNDENASPAALFRLSMLRQLDRLFAFESNLAAEANQTPDLFDANQAKPHAMMDARMNDLLPPEHVKFAMFDSVSTHQLLGQIAYHGAFGRNGQALVANLKELDGVLAAKKQAFDSLTDTTVEGKKRQAKERGLDYDDLTRSVKRYAEVMGLKSKIEAALGVRNVASPMHDARAGLEMLGFVVGQAVDKPTTAMLNLLSLAQRPFMQRSLGPSSIKGTAAAFAEFFKSGFGDFFRSFGIDLTRNADYEAVLGAVEGKAFRDVPWGVALSDIGKEGKFQETNTDRFLIRPLRLFRAIQKKGVGAGPLAIPGMGVMSRIQALASIANTRGNIKQLESVITKGINYFSTHPEALNDPTFRFTPDALGMWSWDHGAFDWMNDMVTEYGMGTLEDIVRNAIPRQEAGEKLLTNDQALKIAQMTAQELDGAMSINTTPSILSSNKALSYAIPLLRWPLWMMHATHKTLADRDGQMNYKSMLRGFATIAAWNLPIALAFTFMVDEYDEKLLGRKNALPEAEGVSAIPLVGPALALATTDREIPQELLAMGQRLMRAGNVYGLGGDMIGQFIAPFDPGSGQRTFSLDQRVLVMSQLLNVQQAVRNWVAQGESTWGSVWRPFVNSIGGSGALHSLDLVNSIAGLDNQESRLIRRLNAQRWVNAAAREVGIETKPAGMYGTPTPVSAQTREMFTAAMAGDRLGFMESYQKALNAARLVVGNDADIRPGDREKEAAERVMRSWRSRNPFSWLPAKPTDQQWREMLGIMSDQGRQDTEDAVRRYEQFTRFIAPSQAQQYVQRQMRSQTRIDTPESLRRRMANQMMMAVP